MSDTDATAIALFCLKEGTKNFCLGWNQTNCQSPITMNDSQYTVVLPPGTYIDNNKTIIATTAVTITISVTGQQARALADWINANVPKNCSC